MSQAIACKTCGLVHEMDPLPPGTYAECTRCGSEISRRTKGRLHLTAAFTLAALILYVPANILPILRFELYGAASENTVWQGTLRLYRDGDTVVAAIVFLASMVIPLLKLIGLLYLVIASQFEHRHWQRTRTWIFKAIETIGRWAMLDVFVLAVLVSLVKLQRLGTVYPGEGLLAFSLVVVFTLFASLSFDPQLIWETEEIKE